MYLNLYGRIKYSLGQSRGAYDSGFIRLVYSLGNSPDKAEIYTSILISIYIQIL